MLFVKRCDIIVFAKWLGVAQLVARYLGVVEAVGSSPVTQTRKTPAEMQAFFFLLQPMNFRLLALDFSLAGGPAHGFKFIRSDLQNALPNSISPNGERVRICRLARIFYGL